MTYNFFFSANIIRDNNINVFNPLYSGHRSAEESNGLRKSKEPSDYAGNGMKTRGSVILFDNNSNVP